MPKQYEAIRDALTKRGTPYDKSQSIAAATYNKQHPNHPMGGKHHEPGKGHQGGKSRGR